MSEAPDRPIARRASSPIRPRAGTRANHRDRPRQATPLEESRKWRQCEAEEHCQGQGLQHLGREWHRANDRRMRKVTTAGWSIGDLR